MAPTENRRSARLSEKAKGAITIFSSAKYAKKAVMVTEGK